jgi:hypothetical protein
MGTAAKPTRENRTITVDFRDEATYFCLIADGKAFLEFVFAFLLSLGFQLKHKATCHGGGCLTRHSHYVRIRLGGVTIWRIQCTTCKAVFTVLSVAERLTEGFYGASAPDGTGTMLS